MALIIAERIGMGCAAGGKPSTGCNRIKKYRNHPMV
jgi:hypothetical protein